MSVGGTRWMASVQATWASRTPIGATGLVELLEAVAGDHNPGPVQWASTVMSSSVQPLEASVIVAVRC